MEEQLLERLRADLAAADFRSNAVRALLGAEADDARTRGVLEPAFRAIAERGPSALGTLIRLFLLGGTVSDVELDAALGSLGAAGARSLGLVAGDPGEPMTAALSVNPVDLDPLPVNGTGEPPRETDRDWWFISDLDDHLRRGPARPEHVMGVGGATRSLLAQVPPLGPGIRSALDLGTGCGVIALALARAGVPEILACDVSARALMFARANACLNGVRERVTFLEGDLFDPVAGKRFDLILSNPPFVITPRDAPSMPRYEYRDGGERGDDLAAAVVRTAPMHLQPGGALVCLANWESPWGVDGLERVRTWIEDAGVPELSAWVIERDRVSPVRYAETWARDGGARPGEAEFSALIDAWLEDFSARRIVSIGLGAVHVHRDLDAVPGAGCGPIRLQRVTEPLAVRPGAALARAFGAGIAAARMSDAQMLETRWQRQPGVSEVREHAPGQEAPRSIALRIDAPFTRMVDVDPVLAAAIGACDGELTLDQLASALASILELEESDLVPALLGGVRELAWLGAIAPEATEQPR